MSSSGCASRPRSEEHTSELQSRRDLVCRLLLEKKKPRPPLGSGVRTKDGDRFQDAAQRTSGRKVSHSLFIPLVAGLSSISFDHYFFFFNDTATTEIYTLSLHDALPI